MTLPVQLTLWVTSECTKDCPRCSHKLTRREHAGYSMGVDELENIIKSSVARGLHYKLIELTGGEVTLWPHLEYAVDALWASGICDEIFFVTNGNDPQRVVSLSDRLTFYVVSDNSATHEQLIEHEQSKCLVLHNAHQHVPIPTSPLTGSLPAVCCVAYDPMRRGIRINQVIYLRGYVYCCCNAFPNALQLGIDVEPLRCSFHEDFVARMADKDYSHPICAVCCCNQRVFCLSKQS